jgi:hypothetical protein
VRADGRLPGGLRTIGIGGKYADPTTVASPPEGEHGGAGGMTILLVTTEIALMAFVLTLFGCF